MNTECAVAQITPDAGPHLSTQQFVAIRELLHRTAGIRLTPAQRIMAEVRLRRRLRHLGLSSFSEYCDLLFAPDQIEEPVALIDCLTVNKTNFFREAEQFGFLTRNVLPQWTKESRRPLAVWSAACSTGEEVYTLAMVLGEYFGFTPEHRFTIHGSDISRVVLRHAVRAVYAEEAAQDIPKRFRDTCILRGRGPQQGFIRMSPAVRQLAHFSRFNLAAPNLEGGDLYDVIFCRNVLIYFDRETQETVIRRLARRLTPGGHLFIGHAETLNGFQLPLVSVAPATYRKAE